MTISLQKCRTLLYAFIGVSAFAIVLLVKFCGLGSSLHTSMLAIAVILTLMLFYTSLNSDINYQSSNAKQDNLNNKNIRLALNFQGQGKLDAAYALFKQCKYSEKLITLLKNLAQDYEIIKQHDKANIVYVYITNLQSGAEKEISKPIIHEKKKAPVTNKSIDDKHTI